jgi:Fic family protein
MARYIWQRGDWSRFRWDANRLLSPLGDCRRAQGLLLGRTRDLGVGPVRRLRASVLEEETVRTAAIEGVEYSVIFALFAPCQPGASAP